MVLEDRVREDQRAGAVGDQFGPVVTAGRCKGGGAEAKIDRTIGIGEDIEVIAMMLDAVFVAGFAGCDQAGLGVGVMGVEEVDFAGLVVGDVDQEIVAGLGLAEVDVEGGVGLLKTSSSAL